MNVELLEKVKQAILEEPKRVDMAAWIRNPQMVDKSDKPACNTVACIGGWAIALKVGLRGRPLYQHRVDYMPTAHDVAQQYLQLSDTQADKLFYTNNWPYNLRREIWGIEPGTPEYAQIVAKRIDAMIATQAKPALPKDKPKRKEKHNMTAYIVVDEEGIFQGAYASAEGAKAGKTKIAQRLEKRQEYPVLKVRKIEVKEDAYAPNTR